MYSDKEYLELLSDKFPTIQSVTTEIINLEAILELPKPTERFLSDLHGEFGAVDHVFRNGSGNVKIKIRELFEDELSEKEMTDLATVVYYPEQKVEQVLKNLDNDEDKTEYLHNTLERIIELANYVISKYTRSKVRKALPKERAYIMEELLFKDNADFNKGNYYHNIVMNVIELGEGPALIADFAKLIQDLVVDHTHILGDIYDRGPNPEKILDKLMTIPSIDIQWGNHEITWMGAASGSKVMIATVIRICARYDNLSILEDAYGISLRNLISFAEATYPDENLEPFMPHVSEDSKHFPDELKQLAKIQQAIAIIQFKLEGPVFKRHPEFGCDSRCVMEKIDYDAGTVTLDNGKTYELINKAFPTVDPEDPYRLSPVEDEIMNKLQHSFLNSRPLQQHISFLLQKGASYTVYNNNLMFHGCIPMKDEKTFMPLRIDGVEYAGRSLLNVLDQKMRTMYANRQSDESKNPDLDYALFMWQGEGSPLFGKMKMATFERYYIEDKETHKEERNIYYSLRDNEEYIDMLLREFGIDPRVGHVINGHTPVKEKKGESPIKANGKMIVIDGGFSDAYQGTTGIAGYSLLYNSHGMQLVSHTPFHGVEDAVENGTDIEGTRRIVDEEVDRLRVRDTDTGKSIRHEVDILKKLLEAYKSGLVKEKRVN